MRPNIIVENKKFYILDPLEHFEIGKGRRYEINGVDIAAFLINDKVICVDGACPHEGASMAQGWIANNCVTCPRHGWQFKTKDGTAAKEGTCNIGFYETIIQDDNVWVCVE